MAEDAAAVADPLLSGLPDEIVLWEILVRVDPKSLLRCRAVRRDWRRVTSTRRFLLANSSRQPTLPILTSQKSIDGVSWLEILTFDHRAAANARLRTVARLDDDFFLEASCDGLLVLSKLATDSVIHRTTLSTVCNPATREHASLGPPWDFDIMGMYSHPPTGEYRLLLRPNNPDPYLPRDQIGGFVFAVGSDQPPRYIGWPEVELGFYDTSVQVRESLHWYLVYYPTEDESCPVIVFDTIGESFRLIRAPVGASLIRGSAALFEMEGMLGMYCRNDGAIDIWMMQDYESEVWSFKYHVEFAPEIRAQYGDFNFGCNVMVVPGDGELFLMLQSCDGLLQVGTDGKLVASFRHQHLSLTDHQLKQTLVSDTFFPTLEGYIVNAWPFM